jgi:hypothetical protein
LNLAGSHAELGSDRLVAVAVGQVESLCEFPPYECLSGAHQAEHYDFETWQYDTGVGAVLCSGARRVFSIAHL